MLGVIWAIHIGDKELIKAVCYSDMLLENINPIGEPEDVGFTFEPGK